MTKLTAILVACFAAAFAAGVGVGLVLRGSPEPPGRRSDLVRDLALTRKQAEQAKAIWAEAWQKFRARPGDRREALDKERDAAIRSVLAKEQTARYDEIQAEHRRKLDKLGEERRAIFEAAEARMKEILTDAQRAKYDALIEKKATGGPGHPSHRPHGGPRGPRDAPSGPPPEKQM